MRPELMWVSCQTVVSIWSWGRFPSTEGGILQGNEQRSLTMSQRSSKRRRYRSWWGRDKGCRSSRIHRPRPVHILSRLLLETAVEKSRDGSSATLYTTFPWRVNILRTLAQSSSLTFLWGPWDDCLDHDLLSSVKRNRSSRNDRYSCITILLLTYFKISTCFSMHFLNSSTLSSSWNWDSTVTLMMCKKSGMFETYSNVWNFVTHCLSPEKYRHSTWSNAVYPSLLKLS